MSSAMKHMPFDDGLDDPLDLAQHYIDPSIAGPYPSTTSDHQHQQHQHQHHPQLPPGADPKKTCPFCHRTFSHPGSMGRHLDLKKGSRLHPAALIDALRANVHRRGDQAKVKERRRARARIYNSRIDIKERNRSRRKTRDKLHRYKSIAINTFYHNLPHPQIDHNSNDGSKQQASLARLILYFQPPDSWPLDIPNLESYKHLCNHLTTRLLPQNSELYNDVMDRIQTAFNQWITLSEEVKLEIWCKELRAACQDSLGNMSLYELNNRDQLITNEASKMMEAKQYDKENENGSHKNDKDYHNNSSNGNENDNDDENGNDNNNDSDDADNDNSDNDIHKNKTTIYNQAELEAVAQAVAQQNEKSYQSHHNL